MSMYRAQAHPTVERVPSQDRRPLARAVGMKIGMQESEPTNHLNSITGPRRVMIFPYHPLAYRILVRELYFEGITLKPLTSRPAIPTIDCARRFDKLLTPFIGMSHFDEGVIFDGVSAGHPKLELLREALRRPQQAPDPIDDMVTLKKNFQSQGRAAESRCQYMNAMCRYFVRIDRTFSGTNEFDMMNQSEIAEHKIPLLGTWGGSPGLWGDWNDGERYLMKQFRLQHNLGPSGQVGTPEDLTRYTIDGIMWAQVSRNEIDATVS